MVDLKALMGDASDNIPGVPGIGEKTALDLVRRFGRVENIYARLDELDIKDSVRKKLAAGEESARMSYELATISREAPVELLARRRALAASAVAGAVRRAEPPGLQALYRQVGP